MKEEEIPNQSGVIPFRFHKENLELLLITSLRQKYWIFPKGDIEEGLSAIESAAKEALEEAGVKGKVYPEEIGRYDYSKERGLFLVSLFPMEVEEVCQDWPEAKMRQRQWVSLSKALAMINWPDLRRIAGRLPALIDK